MNAMISTISEFNNIHSVSGKKPVVDNQVSFGDFLSNKIDDIKFSKHAEKRLEERNLSLTDDQTKRLAAGMEKAGAKGIRDSLMIMDSMAFIVNVPSQTVVTAIGQNESTDKIFTNIDGAVIV